jgi:hypothetical protein
MGKLIGKLTKGKKRNKKRKTRNAVVYTNFYDSLFSVVSPLACSNYLVSPTSTAAVASAIASTVASLTLFPFSTTLLAAATIVILEREREREKTAYDNNMESDESSGSPDNINVDVSKIIQVTEPFLCRYAFDVILLLLEEEEKEEVEKNRKKQLKKQELLILLRIGEQKRKMEEMKERFKELNQKRKEIDRKEIEMDEELEKHEKEFQRSKNGIGGETRRVC